MAFGPVDDSWKAMAAASVDSWLRDPPTEVDDELLVQAMLTGREDWFLRAITEVKKGGNDG